ncbi:PAS domain S-box protein, partial [Candidatus Latescibacterota bacterium]
MQLKKNSANDLFLLMFNLSQMSSKEKIISLYINAIDEIWPDLSTEFVLSVSDNSEGLITISASETVYGYLSIENFSDLQDEDQSLIHNACCMLAIILKNIEQNQLLADEKMYLNKLVEERTHNLTCEVEERKQAEESLNHALQKLSFHIENSPLAMIEFNNDFKITQWSNNAEKIFGWSAGEILEKRIGEFKWVHEDDADRIAALSVDIFAGHKASNIHLNR